VPEKYTSGNPSLVEVAIVAALLDPKAAGSKNPGPVIRKAAKLIDAVASHLPFADLSTDKQRALLAKQAAANSREWREWKMHMGSPMLLSELADAPWSRYKSVREILDLLKRVKFPKRFRQLGAITEAAYRLALKKDTERAKNQDRARRQKSRAHQVSEPIKRNRSRTKAA